MLQGPRLFRGRFTQLSSRAVPTFSCFRFCIDRWNATFPDTKSKVCGKVHALFVKLDVFFHKQSWARKWKCCSLKSKYMKTFAVSSFQMLPGNVSATWAYNDHNTSLPERQIPSHSINHTQNQCGTPRSQIRWFATSDCDLSSNWYPSCNTSLRWEPHGNHHIVWFTSINQHQHQHQHPTARCPGAPTAALDPMPCFFSAKSKACSARNPPDQLGVERLIWWYV